MDRNSDRGQILIEFCLSLGAFLLLVTMAAYVLDEIERKSAFEHQQSWHKKRASRWKK